MEYTLEHLANNAKELSHATGRFTGYYDGGKGKIDINYSSILTVLIQQTGRLCDAYASDLFIQWNAMFDRITDSEVLSKATSEGYTESFLFGIRDTGVDHTEWVLGNLKDYKQYGTYYYRDIYVVKVTVKNAYISFANDEFEGDIEMTLGKCSY